MKLPESETNSPGPTVTLMNNHQGGILAGPSGTNGHTSLAPSSNGVVNGHSGKQLSPIASTSTSVARVALLGQTLYDDSDISREEFVRLCIQSLRDVGYIESAATLEAESGYTMETSQVAEFRQHVLEGSWDQAEQSLATLGVKDPEHLRSSRVLISQQKYLELLESRNITSALQILRTELAPLKIPMEKLHTLSSYMMCNSAEDIRSRARWDGATGTSRRRLLIDLQKYIPSAVMIPSRRFESIINQARLYQRQNCLYHNSNDIFSLYGDHECTRTDFPTLTTNILAHHDDEVWQVQWSHDGRYLATASKDKTAIIWKIGPPLAPAQRECSMERVLREHAYPVNCIAWSPDDKLLLTTSDAVIKVWNAKTGVCTRELSDGHTDIVMAIVWLPDGTGFVTGGMDRKIVVWNVDGSKRDNWGPVSIRIADLAVTPDQRRIVAVGLITMRVPNQQLPGATVDGTNNHPPIASSSSHRYENRMVIFNLADKREEISVKLDGELTSIKTSSDSRYALINHAPDELQMWDLETARMTRKFTGQRQGKHIIRSCFGGAANNFILSGSEDSNVYVWHRDTGVLLEILKGHDRGSVNSVAWHPHEERVFASCSDDCTVRVWEPPPPDLDIELPPQPLSPIPEPQVFEHDSLHNLKGKARQSRSPQLEDVPDDMPNVEAPASAATTA